MIYWLFTDGRALLGTCLAPLLCLALPAPLVFAALLGAGIQRTTEPQQWQGWKRGGRVGLHLLITLTVTALYLTLVGDFALHRSRTRTTLNQVIQFLVGAPRQLDSARLLLSGFLLVFAGFLVNIGLHNGIKNGGWLRERLDRMRQPEVKRGALGSSHFCTPREYKRFRREDAEGLTLLGAFWGDGKRRLDLGTGRFSLSGEDIARGILTLGGPGSGKTQGIILPAIADRMLAGHSLVVADPQGEITTHVL
ncbi:MAG: type IV secretory system conjugative DNA transfer family protein, partial [bacterium]|nr:type IV secretory system conjugative DNA transfer family protein [bacterium]